MLQAFSQSKSSDGSAIGVYLTEFLGLGVGAKGLSKKPKFQELLNTYSKTIISEAQKDPVWSTFSDLIRIGLTKGNKIRVYIEADKDIVDEANLIEFGNGGTPARPLMRKYEAQFNDDFYRRKMFKS